MSPDPNPIIIVVALGLGFPAVIFLGVIASKVEAIAKCLRWQIDYIRDPKRTIERQP